MRPYRNLRDGLRADVGRAIAMASWAVLVAAPVEYAITVWTYPGSTSLVSKLELVALTATLSAVFWLLLVLALAGGLVAVRFLRSRLSSGAATEPGVFALGPLDRGIRATVPRLWAGVVGAAILGVIIQRVAGWAIARFKEPQLTAAVIAGIAIAAVVACAPIHRLLVVGLSAAARRSVRLGVYNPLGRWRAAGTALVALAIGGLVAAWYLSPASRSVIPTRLIATGMLLAIGAGLGAWRHAVVKPRTRSKRDARLGAAGAFAAIVTTLLWWGGDLEAKYTAVTASPALDKMIDLVRTANDFDRDGFGSLLGEADCAPLTSGINPGALDTPGDGVDQDCDGVDTTLADLTPPQTPVVPVPERFRKDWNILLLTVDALRYDRTSFGGYKRDTTPRLAKLVEHSTSFVYANAPAPGTMASIPAILTSKFFHSGIAIDDEHKRPGGYPPKVLDDNLTLPELLKSAGYHTGAIGSHEWWTNWGIEQGFDDFDNEIGKVPDAYRVVANKVTDHALAFMSRNQSRKWFLWAHYIDPHGRYVAHPDVVDYGSSEPDLYDAEIRWTDQEIGRLLDEMSRLPKYKNTIVIVTSDHGESMGEHGVPSGTHGTALYRELTHVPLIFYIPDNKPKQLRGAVSPLDIFPTVAAFAGIDTSRLKLEGQSLIGPLFYGTEDRERIVFTETNAPVKRRAAISERYRLIYALNSNIYEFYDHDKDPNETTNLALTGDPPGLDQMKKALSNWMNRVMYDRDPKFNQSFRLFMADVIMKEPPTPTVTTTDQILDDKIEILGIANDPTKRAAPGSKADFHVYFHVKEPLTTTYKLQLVGWPIAEGGALTDPIPGGAPRSSLRLTADGAYPTSAWPKGEYIRERFTITLPTDWKSESIALGLVAQAKDGKKAKPSGAKPSNDSTIFALGVLPVKIVKPTGSGS